MIALLKAQIRIHANTYTSQRLAKAIERMSYPNANNISQS